MSQNFKKLLFTATGKDTSVVLFGTLVNVILGGLFFIFAPRLLGPQNFGIFSVVMATGLMATNFANFGIDTGLLKFLKVGQEEENKKILKLSAKAYLVIGIATFALGLIISASLSSLLGIPQYSNLLKIAFTGVIFLLFTNFFVATLQTRKKFLEASFVNISSNAARILILVLASYFATLDLYFITALFFFVTIISIIVGKLFVPFDFLKVKDEHLHLKNFFGYNFWIAAGLAISSVPFDNYILVKLAGPLATGIFAAPMKILSTTYQFAGSFSRVLAPRYSSFETKSKTVEFTKKTLPFVIIIFIVLVVVGAFSNSLTRLFLGKDYSQSASVFRIVSVGMAFFFAETIPMAILLYNIGKSQIAFIVTVFHYLIYAMLLIYLVPQKGANGAALAFTISEALTFLVLSTYVALHINKR